MVQAGAMSVLVLSLFIAHRVGMASGADIIGSCSDQNGMTDSVRRVFLNTHNKYRSLVAKGQASGLYGRAPSAARMLKMVYDCNIERTAMQHTRKCRFGHSPRSSRPNLGENVYVRWSRRDTFEQAAKQSCDSWFEELKTAGMPPSNILTSRVFNRPKAIGHYTQMVWQNTYKIGCAVVNCQGSMTLVTCQYGPAGNMLNQMVYEKGRPCQSDNDCRCSGCQCSRSEALCVRPV